MSVYYILFYIIVLIIIIDELRIENIVTEDPKCYNILGKATVNVTGGTLPYSASWKNITNGIADASSSLNVDLKWGNYYVTITDAQNCVNTSNFVLVNPPGLLLCVFGIPLFVHLF